MTTNRLAIVSLALLLQAGTAAAGGPLASYAPSLTPELKARLAQADLAAGEKYYERKCSQCHDALKSGGHAKGPHLWNVMGRKAGSVPGFDFSEAMKKAGIAWDFATLDYYLTDTETAVPGRAMNFVGIRDEQLRANVIAFLRTLNDNPAPLP
jgi:cytochrome c